MCRIIITTTENFGWKESLIFCRNTWHLYRMFRQTSQVICKSLKVEVDQYAGRFQRGNFCWRGGFSCGSPRGNKFTNWKITSGVCGVALFPARYLPFCPIIWFLFLLLKLHHYHYWYKPKFRSSLAPITRPANAALLIKGLSLLFCYARNFSTWSSTYYYSFLHGQLFLHQYLTAASPDCKSLKVEVDQYVGRFQRGNFLLTRWFFMRKPQR